MVARRAWIAVLLGSLLLMPSLAARPDGAAGDAAEQPTTGAPGAGAAPPQDLVLRAPGLAGRALEAGAARLGLPLDPLWPELGLYRARLAPAHVALLQRWAPFLAEPDAQAQAQLATASQWFGATKARADFGVTGDRDGREAAYATTDVGVCVVDTGIDPAHPDLAGKTLAWRDFVAGVAQPYDDNGHGTHVAGIVAGTGAASGGAHRGVAPGAFLAVAKVLDNTGSGSTSSIIEAVRWCTQQAGVKVVNLSLGGTGCSDGNDALSTAVDQANAQGFVVVAAAGNRGPARCTIASPGAARGALTIGALADHGEGGIRLASFSSRGPTWDGRTKPDLLAPGVNIAAPAAHTGGYVGMSGTSMAAPYAAGTVALMLDANPALTPAQVRQHLKATAGDWGARGPDLDWGGGRIKTYEAVKVAGGFQGTGPGVGATKTWTLRVNGTGQAWFGALNVSSSQPLAVTMLHDRMVYCSPCQPDLDLYLYPPGTSLAGTTAERHARALVSSEGTNRQETAWVMAPARGPWTLEVYSYDGADGAVLSAGFAP